MRKRRRGKPRLLTLEQLEAVCVEEGTKVRLGFTGTAKELSPLDVVKVVAMLLALTKRWPNAVIITGGCVGVDEMVAIAMHTSGAHVHTVLPFDHDKVDPSWQKHCSSYWQMLRTSDDRSTRYMHRNDELVKRSTHMGAAFPDSPEGRSGTWATIHRFRRKGVNTKRIVILDS